MVIRQVGEAFVLLGDAPSRMRFRPIPEGDAVVRSRYRPDAPGTTRYTEGVDYAVDYEQGTIRRIPGGRIPDGTQHPMYGVDRFDHLLYPDFSNRDFTVYVDYSSVAPVSDRWPSADDVARSGLLERTVGKLSSGEEALYIVYGDSISAGGDASDASLAYYGRFAKLLGELFPEGRLRVENRSISGETSGGGALRVMDDVVSLRPDLVTIGYGMNDQNLYEHGLCTPLALFERNMRTIVEAVRTEAGSDVLLVTSCEPNPRWRHSSGEQSRFSETILRLAQELGVGAANAHARWLEELQAGKTPESLLLNNINHPNDYGHWVYFQAFLRLFRAG